YTAAMPPTPSSGPIVYLPASDCPVRSWGHARASPAWPVAQSWQSDIAARIAQRSRAAACALAISDRPDALPDPAAKVERGPDFGEVARQRRDDVRRHLLQLDREVGERLRRNLGARRPVVARDPDQHVRESADLVAREHAESLALRHRLRPAVLGEI